MSLTVNTNVASLSAQRSMLNTNSALQTSFERLASGKRINSASDDAAGLAVSQSLTSAINGVNQAMRNANDGISAAQIAEGALSEVSDILQRMRELAVQANTSFLSSTEKGYLQKEQVALESALGDVTTAAKFSGTSLFAASTFTFQTGSSAAETSSFTSKAVAASGITDKDGNSVDLTAIDLTAANAAATANNASLAGGAQALVCRHFDDQHLGLSRVQTFQRANRLWPACDRQHWKLRPALFLDQLGAAICDIRVHRHLHDRHCADDPAACPFLCARRTHVSAQNRWLLNRLHRSRGLDRRARV